MRFFECFAYPAAYKSRLDQLAIGAQKFSDRLSVFLSDRYGASHILLPVDSRDPDAFFTNWNDEKLQRSWAREAGLGDKLSLEVILLAQIENHRAEVFYTIDPVRLGNTFLKKLPGCVKRTVAWRAAPGVATAFSNYNVIVNNFPSILAGFENEGCRTAYLAPSHDPAMNQFATNEKRPVDVVFVGGYSRYHKRRATVLEAVSRLAGRYRVAMHLEQSRLSRLAESTLGRLLPLTEHRRPASIRSLSKSPVFGMDMYRTLSNAKIVLNGAGEVGGRDRGNMRCFEAMGCGALMLSDEGIYPAGMVDGQTMATYRDPADAVAAIERLLAADEERTMIARNGLEMISTVYSKKEQWTRFQAIVQ